MTWYRLLLGPRDSDPMSEFFHYVSLVLPWPCIGLTRNRLAGFIALPDPHGSWLLMTLVRSRAWRAKNAAYGQHLSQAWLPFS